MIPYVSLRVFSGDVTSDLYCTSSQNIIKDNMDANEEDEDEELQRLDGDGEEDEAEDIVVGDPKESGQGRCFSQLGAIEAKLSKSAQEN